MSRSTLTMEPQPWPSNFNMVSLLLLIQEPLQDLLLVRTKYSQNIFSLIVLKSNMNFLVFMFKIFLIIYLSTVKLPILGHVRLFCWYFAKLFNLYFILCMRVVRRVRWQSDLYLCGIWYQILAILSHFGSTRRAKLTVNKLMSKLIRRFDLIGL